MTLKTEDFQKKILGFGTSVHNGLNRNDIIPAAGTHIPNIFIGTFDFLKALLYAELTTRYEKTKRKQDGVLREIEIRAAKARALDAFERELLETESMNVSFSAVRFNAMVERVDVFPEGRMVFRFVCGREIVV